MTPAYRKAWTFHWCTNIDKYGRVCRRVRDHIVRLLLRQSNSFECDKDRIHQIRTNLHSQGTMDQKMHTVYFRDPMKQPNHSRSVLYYISLTLSAAIIHFHWYLFYERGEISLPSFNEGNILFRLTSLSSSQTSSRINFIVFPRPNQSSTLIGLMLPNNCANILSPFTHAWQGPASTCFDYNFQRALFHWGNPFVKLQTK